MSFEEFAEFHLPALEADEVRFNVNISVIKTALKSLPDGFHYWTLGGPGHCATQSPSRSILLGFVSEGECRRLARETKDAAYPGVLGSSGTANWFVDEASDMGLSFPEVIRQRIYTLTEQPFYPGSEGGPRAAVPEDEDLLLEWMIQFHREAVPEDLEPGREFINRAAASGRWMFWTVDGKPVSVAAIARELRTVSAIGSVFTPPEYRGRGYAGSVTAALCERVFADGKTAACLYTDLDNLYSNRCYQKIGFKPYCDSDYYLRSRQSRTLQSSL